jgi:hypothetical protein
MKLLNFIKYSVTHRSREVQPHAVFVKWQAFALIAAGCTLFHVASASAQTAPLTLANTSALVNLLPGGNASLGFVVNSTAGTGQVLVRAIGPKLASFGVKGALAIPAFQLFGPNGKTSGYGVSYSAIINWNATFATVGAFQLSQAEQAANPFVIYALPTGVYTIQVSDGGGGGGIVLIEVYTNVVAIPVPGSSI